jgi:hypothetical protein
VPPDAGAGRKRRRSRQYREAKIALSLFDMENDPYETKNVLEQHPDVVRRLQGYADEHRRKFYADQQMKR